MSRETVWAQVFDEDYTGNSRMEWLRSRASGSALVLWSGTTDLGWIRRHEQHAFHLESQRNENERRDAATPFVCGVALMAYEESRRIYAERLARGLGATSLARALLARDSAPSYTEMRNFLVGELDARYVVACAAAFARVEMNNRLDRSQWREVDGAWSGPYRERAERGWL